MGTTLACKYIDKTIKNNQFFLDPAWVHAPGNDLLRCAPWLPVIE